MEVPKIRSLTQPEIDKLIELCNFTDDELDVFKLKAKDKTITYIALTLKMSESKVSVLVKRIKKKIYKVLPYC